MPRGNANGRAAGARGMAAFAGVALAMVLLGGCALVPDGGATWHLARTLGRKRAFELIALGEKLGAAKCLEYGLCNQVVPADRLLDEELLLAEKLAAKAPLSLRYSKEAVNAAMSQSVDQTISNEARLQKICVNSEDAREGALAFLQKRPAQFKGR